MRLACGRFWRCCEFIACECDLAEGGEETANFLQTRDKYRIDDAVFGAAGAECGFAENSWGGGGGRCNVGECHGSGRCCAHTCHQ
jgi:hypothetical protein